MLENKRSRVYCFCAVRSYHRSSRSAPKTRSREARTMTEMGLFCTNRSNTSPSMAASLMTKLKKAYRIQDRHTLTPLAQELTGKQCEKLAEWGERAALGGLGSLVVQQIILGVPITRPSVIVGALVSAFAYYKAYQWLKLSNTKS